MRLDEVMGAALSTAPEDRVEDILLVQAVRNDPAAFALIYDRFRDRVYWYLRTRTPTDDDAADLLQQVFLQALERISQYNPKKGPFAGWLFGIARNAAINAHRGRRATVSWDLIPDVLRPVSRDDPEAQALRNESLDRLATAFADLDPAKRELLVLRYIAGLSFAEIATSIGKSETSVRQQVSRTLRILKEQNRDID